MYSVLRIFGGLILTLFFSVQYFGQQSSVSISTKENIEASVRLAPCDSDARMEAAKKLFIQAGAKDEDISFEKFGKDKYTNIIIGKKGKSDEKIIVGAHYDKVEAGCGAIDNWTGVVILAHLYRTLSLIDSEKTFVFVAFDQEETGLNGSEAMAKTIPKNERSQYCAMVNLDSFGLAYPRSFRETSDSKLISLAKIVSKETTIPFSDISVADADADSTSFRHRNIPSITLTGLNNNWQNYLHTKNDKLENINFDSVYFGYRFALVLLAKLDASSCSDFH